MARPKRDGLFYFSFDVDFFSDKKIKSLNGRYKNDGIVFYIYLLTEIYKNGYYIRWDEDYEDNAMCDLNLTEGFIKQVMTFLTNRSLLTSITVGTDTILTSPGIQKRYQEAVKSLKRDIFVEKNIWLLSMKETATCIKYTINPSESEINPSKSEINPSKSEINPTKEIKGNEKKLNEMKEKESKKAAETACYFPNDEKLNQIFLDYIDMRKTIKAPMTDHAIDLAIKKLKDLSSEGEMMDNDIAIAILEQSIMCSWKGLFELKKANYQKKSDYIDKWRNV